MSAKKAWATIEELARYEYEGWNDPILLEEGSLDYKNPKIKKLLGVMKCKVDMLMKNVISLMGRSEDVYGMTSDMIPKLLPKPSRQEAFEDLVMNFIHDQEENIKQLEEYMCIIGRDKRGTNPLIKPHSLDSFRLLCETHHVIAFSESRNSSKNMLRFSSNDMVHNHYLDEARKKTQEKGVNLCAKVPSHKTTNRNKPAEQIRIAKKPERQIPTWHRFSIKKTSVVHEKTMTPRSCLRWKPMGKIFKTVGLRILCFKLETLSKRFFSKLNLPTEPEVNVMNLCTNAKAISSISVFTNFKNALISRISRQRCQGRLLASFQDDAKYEHVCQDLRSQDGKDNKEKQGQDLKILKTKLKDNDKGSRSKITKREGTSLQHDKDQRFKNSMKKRLQQVQGRKIQDSQVREFKDRTLGEIVSLKYVFEHGSSESTGNLASGEIVSLKILSRIRKLSS
ncbi:hypothetical protein Tco_1107451 [Tanacetum coccineum]